MPSASGQFSARSPTGLPDRWFCSLAWWRSERTTGPSSIETEVASDGLDSPAAVNAQGLIATWHRTQQTSPVGRTLWLIRIWSRARSIPKLRRKYSLKKCYDANEQWIIIYLWIEPCRTIVDLDVPAAVVRKLCKCYRVRRTVLVTGSPVAWAPAQMSFLSFEAEKESGLLRIGGRPSWGSVWCIGWNWFPYCAIFQAARSVASWTSSRRWWKTVCPLLVGKMGDRSRTVLSRSIIRKMRFIFVISFKPFRNGLVLSCIRHSSDAWRASLFFSMNLAVW